MNSKAWVKKYLNKYFALRLVMRFKIFSDLTKHQMTEIKAITFNLTRNKENPWKKGGTFSFLLSKMTHCQIQNGTNII